MFPPDALLVWADWIPSPDAYITPYISARKDGIAEVLGTPLRNMSFDDTASELLMHIRQIAPLLTMPGDVQIAQESLTWDQAPGKYLALCGSHILLTDRAKRLLEKNAYPDCSRMFQFFQSLASLAETYHSNRGQVGERLATFALSEFGIEIALFDKRYDGVTIEHEGRRFEVGPHVKVDDFKSPDTCGRIYFSLDSERFRFIVDHVGLHDYLE